MSSSRPEPVMDAAKIAGTVSGAVTGVGGLLVLFGYATTEDVRSWAVAAGGAVTGIGALLAAVLPIITAIGARGQVTPLADPKTVDGAALTPDRPSAELAAQIAALLDHLDEDARPVETQARAAIVGQG